MKAVKQDDIRDIRERLIRMETIITERKVAEDTFIKDQESRYATFERGVKERFDRYDKQFDDISKFIAQQTLTNKILGVIGGASVVALVGILFKAVFG